MKTAEVDCLPGGEGCERWTMLRGKLEIDEGMCGRNFSSSVSGALVLNNNQKKQPDKNDV